MLPTLLYRLAKNARRESHPKTDSVELEAVVLTPLFIELTDDVGIKVYINTNHILSMMPYTLRKKEYTKVETRTDIYYVEETPKDILALIREAAGTEG
jgi:hypothetical protein